METVLIGLALFFILATLLPLIPLGHWWIRIFDFPRGQIAVSGVVILVIYAILWNRESVFEAIVLGVLACCVLYQGYRMFPYTPLAPKQVLRTDSQGNPSSLALLVANVLMDNREVERFLEIVQQYDPDLILTVETDHWWEEQLRVLEEDYPHTIKRPIDNTYGMLLHSRLELVDPQIKELVEEDVPSFHTDVRLPSGDLVRLHGVHPKPPAPQEAKTSTPRDAELLIVGREVKKREEGPIIVAGDLNDVAWSSTTSLFQKTSGLLDPRQGRGMYNTFSAKNPLARWPLDHVFHTDEFKLVRLERGPAWGSDHFPVFIELSLEPEAEMEQEEPEADHEEREEANEKMNEVQQKESL